MRLDHMRPLATWSLCKRYRYTLERPDLHLHVEPRAVAFLLLNPSTATETEDDPTIRRCIGFARSWGFTDLTIVNVYALRSTDPRGLWKVDDPVGPDNDKAIAEVAARVETIVCAWGVHAKPARLQRIGQLLLSHRDRVRCLGLTKRGAPRHPLYLSSGTWSEPFDPGVLLVP